TTLARTEIIHAHAESTLNRFEEFGIDGVMGQAEWSTSGDGLVCPRCAAVGGKIYSLSDARGMLPMHPNCRCAWLPVLSSQRR
ncbi:MAG: phage head morphogenesis protein, partial [Planctomycetaceae bacterium]